MKIAQVAPLAEAVPPTLYGGTERIVSYLTEELVHMGHDVTLFASGDSVTSATLRPIVPRALRLDPTVRDIVGYHVLLVEEVARWAHEFDIVHFHIDHYHLPTFCRLDVPFVTTLHGRLDLPELKPLFRSYPKAPFISISHVQRRPVPFTHWAGTVHHGLPESLLSISPHGGKYLAFLGRISPEKGPERAIRIARAGGLKLKIAAKVDRHDRTYFEEVVRPLLGDPAVEFVGEIAEHEKGEFLGGAAALLFPIDWPEPFGLVMIEAMACGTPVIAFNRGAVPEVVEDGTTGFIVEDELGALAAIRRLNEIDRFAVRAEFERRFTARRMAEDHVAIYERIAWERALPHLGLVA